VLRNTVILSRSRYSHVSIRHPGVLALSFSVLLRPSCVFSRAFRRWPILLLAWHGFTVAGALAQSPDQPQTSLTYRFIGNTRQIHTSFELTSNHIYVRVRVNDTGPYWFMLDSGSIFDVLDTEIAKRLGVQLRREIEASGGGEKTVTGATGRNVFLRIAELQLKEGEIYAFPIKNALAEADGPEAGGLLGYDFLSHFVVKIDYARRQIDVFEPAAFHYAGPGEVIPLDMVRGNIMVSADLTMPDGEQVPGTFLVDTGWRSALTLASPFVTDHKLFESVSKTVEAMTGMGVAGPSVDTEARVASLKIGRYKMENLIADFSHARGGVLSQGGFAGIIGGEILRRFTITLDYPRRRMILEPNPSFAAPYEIDMSGLFLTAVSNSAAFKVFSIIKDSPAVQAGIQEGDVIEAIDHRPASKLTLEQIRQILKQGEGKEHLLAIRRDGKMFTARIRLRRLI
jgi:Aspartyl protease/PDZ domain